MKKETIKSIQVGTMTLIDHLKELRIRLIRCAIALMFCILFAYAFRKAILDIIKTPVEVALKKYTTSITVKSKEKETAPRGFYQCSCQETKLTPKISENETILPIPTDQLDLFQTMSVLDSKMTAEDKIDLKKTSSKSDATRIPDSILDPTNEATGDQEISFLKISPIKNNFPEENKSVKLTCHCTKTVPTRSIEKKEYRPGSSMVFIGLSELFFTHMKAAFFAGVFLAFPYLIMELWGFVAPALYRKEKSLYWIFSVFTYICFLGGSIFGYFIVFPYGTDFFISLTQPGEIIPSLSIGDYLSFAVKLLFAFGLIFELPLIAFVLARMGLLTPEWMIKNAKYAIVLFFVASAMLTPPDPFTMLLMATPLMLLYLISILVAYLAVNRKKAAERKEMEGS